MFYLLLSMQKMFIYRGNDEKQLVNVNLFLYIYIYISEAFN